MKKLILLGALVAAHALAFAQKNFIDQPFVEVSAKADSLVVPDRIYLSIRIEEASSKNRKSIEEQEKQMLSALRRAGINTDKDLEMEDLSSSLRTFFLKGKNIIKEKNFNLLVRDANTAARVLLSLEEVDISNINISKIEYSKTEELLLSLKAQAMQKSKYLAQKLAQSVGQKAGKAIFMSDNAKQSPSYGIAGSSTGIMVRGISSMSLKSAPIDVEFKKIKLEAEVSAKYILE